MTIRDACRSEKETLSGRHIDSGVKAENYVVRRENEIVSEVLDNKTVGIFQIKSHRPVT